MKISTFKGISNRSYTDWHLKKFLNFGIVLSRTHCVLINPVIPLVFENAWRVIEEDKALRDSFERIAQTRGKKER